ncbi:HAD-IIA family hydrolase [Portibacter marinus]|uniref:HAD-IIA family hydrolase n=1 Tax=Portibacter marinus TaxID=2898660 RepID=UPI001F1B91FF|nr:HAD-IIA family hydrolase [Portibacter marinus]
MSAGHRMKLSSFEAVQRKYKAIFLDSFGVIKNAHGIIEGVVESVKHMRSLDKEIIILTNDSSRSPKELAANFHRLGLELVDEEDIISSGMMARAFLRNKIKKGTIVYVGTPGSSFYVQGLGRPTVPINDLDIDQIEEVSALVFLDDEGFEWQTHINKCVNLLRLKSIPVIVANTDNTYPVSTREVNIATGAIARMVEKISKKKFIYFGKPDSQMFIYAYERLSKKIRVERNEILMVGDTLRTDIMGGNKFGMSTALVLSGNTSETQMRTYIKSTGIIPNYICPSIAID